MHIKWLTLSSAIGYLMLASLKKVRCCALSGRITDDVFFQGG